MEIYKEFVPAKQKTNQRLQAKVGYSRNQYNARVSLRQSNPHKLKNCISYL